MSIYITINSFCKKSPINEHAIATTTPIIGFQDNTAAFAAGRLI